MYLYDDTLNKINCESFDYSTDFADKTDSENVYNLKLSFGGKDS
jgi:hypothetical protein